MKQPLRVAMIMGGTGHGGLEKHTLELCSALADMGVNVSLIAHPDFAKRIAPGVGFCPVDLTRGRLDPRTLLGVWRALKTIQPHIIHAQANKAAAIVAKLRWVLPRGVRTVATIHNEKSTTWMFKHFDARIAVSGLLAKMLAPWPTIVIHNGVAPRQPVNDANGDLAWAGLAAGPRALAVGRLVPAKGFHNLLEAWQGVEAPLVIAGSGHLRDLLQARIEDLGLTDRVRLLGHRDDIATLMRSSELLVISSRNEGNPYVMIEGLHARVPIISTAVGAIPEILPQQFLCTKDDPEALGARVCRAIWDMDVTRQVYEATFQLAKAELTLEAMARKTLGVYRELVGSATIS